jgi:hypothetical protein
VTYGGDSGNRIFVLYWRCSLIRVSVIRGTTVLLTVFLLAKEYFACAQFLKDLILRNFPFGIKTGLNDSVFWIIKQRRLDKNRRFGTLLIPIFKGQAIQDR